jgi:hypothetical protein
MAANPSGAHQAGELSPAKMGLIGRVRRKGKKRWDAPTPKLKFVEGTVALAEQRSSI